MIGKLTSEQEAEFIVLLDEYSAKGIIPHLVIDQGATDAMINLYEKPELLKMVD